MPGRPPLSAAGSGAHICSVDDPVQGYLGEMAVASDLPPLRLFLLDRFSLRGPDGEVRLPPSKKGRALLAYLSVQRQPTPRSVLAEIFWPDADDARGAIRWTLSRLRKALDAPGVAALQTDRSTVRLDPTMVGTDLNLVRQALEQPDSTDVARMEQAAECFGSTFLDGMTLSECPRFESWLIAMRQEARSLQGRLTAALLDRLSAQPDRALPHARSLRARVPDDDAALLPLLEVLTALGRHDEAQAHHAHQQRRAKENGRSLSRALKLWGAQQQRPRPPSTAEGESTVASGGSPGPGSSFAERIAVDDNFRFVGRADELVRVQRLRDAGQAALFLIGGAPGVGKSRLAVEIAHRSAQDGARVCAGRCEEQAPTVLGPWRDALRQLAGEYAANFSDACAGLEDTIVALMPSLAAKLGVEQRSGEVETYAAMDAIGTVLNRLAQAAPLVVLIDDVQWSDEPSRALATTMIRTHATSPILVLGTYRSTDVDLTPEASRWLRETARLRNVHRVSLRGLDAEDAVSLARSVLGARAEIVADQLFERSQGHGVFLTELLRDVQRGGDGGHIPQSIADLVQARFERLSPEVASLVSVGACLGPEFPVAVAAAALKTPMAEVLRRADAAIGADLLHPSGVHALRFSHQLVPDALRAQQSAPTRARLHHRCAQALTACGGDAADVAFHLLGAVPLVDANDALATARSAARVAHSAWAFDRSERLYRRMLSLPMPVRLRAELLVELGSVLSDGGRVPAGVRPLEDAVKLADVHGWPDILVGAALGHGGRSPYRRVADNRTLRLLERASEYLDGCDDGTAARVLAKTAAFKLFSARLQERDNLSREAVARAAQVSDGDRLEVLEARWVAIGCPLRIDELERLDAELLVLRTRLSRLMADAACPETVLYWRGDGDGFRRELESSRADMRRGRAIDEWRNDVLSGAVAALEGDVGVARTAFRRAARIGAVCWGDSAAMLHAFALLFCDIVEGVPGESKRAFEQLVRVSPSPVLDVCLAWAQVRAGEADSAREVMSQLRVRSVGWFAEHIVGGAALASAAEVAIALDLKDWAEGVERELVRLDGLMLGLPWAPSMAASHVLMKLASFRGDSARAAQYRAKTAEIYDRMGASGLEGLVSPLNRPAP